LTSKEIEIEQKKDEERQRQMLPYHVKDYKPPLEEENKQEKILNPLQRALIKKLTSNFDCST